MRQFQSISILLRRNTAAVAM